MKKTLRTLLILSSICIPVTPTKTASPLAIAGAGIIAGALSYKFPKATIIGLLSLQTMAGFAGANIHFRLSKKKALDGLNAENDTKKAITFLCIGALPLAGLIGYITSPYSKG